jgi:hypothetical protein
MIDLKTGSEYNDREMNQNLSNRSRFPLPCWLNPGALFLLGIVWMTAFCQPVMGEPTSSVGDLPLMNDVSLLVVNIDVFATTGAACGAELAAFLKTHIESGGEHSFDALMKSLGGFWRIIETAPFVQCGLFLPPRPDGGEETAQVFLKHLNLGIRNFTAPTQLQSPLADLLMRKISVPGTGSPRADPVSIWVKGPLEGARTRLGETVKRFPGPVSVGPPPGPEGLVAPGLPPTLAVCLQWGKPTPEILASAKFIGEEAGDVLPDTGPVKYDLWITPEQTTLTLVATGPVDQLFSIRRKIEAFIGRFSTTVDAEKWRRFADVWGQALFSEMRILEKGAFLEGWQYHLGCQLRPLPEMKLQAPPTVSVFSCLPRRSQHRLCMTGQGNPRFITANVEAGRDRIDLAIFVFAEPEVLARISSRLDRRSLPEVGPLLVSPYSEGASVIRISCRADRIPAVLGILRTLVFDCVVAAHELPEAARNPDDSLRRRPDFVIAGVGGFEAYEILGILREAWPLDSGDGLPGRQKLSLETVAAALKPFSPELALSEPVQAKTLKGVWETRTSTPAGLAETLGALIGSGVEFSGLEEVPLLFPSP